MIGGNSASVEKSPLFRRIFTLDSCLPIAGAQLSSFDDEDKMLLAWREFVLEADPDVLIGYNISRFDLPYLILRADATSKQKTVLGRLRGASYFHEYPALCFN